MTAALALCVAFTAQSGIYKWTDADGKVHYSDAVSDEQLAETVTLNNLNTFTDVSISDVPGWKEFYQPERKPGVKNVVMYSTTGCGYCKQARHYFAENGIDYTEKNIEQDPSAWEEFQQLGASGVPVILIGDKQMNGFSPSSFESVFYGNKPASKDKTSR